MDQQQRYLEAPEHFISGSFHATTTTTTTTTDDEYYRNHDDSSSSSHLMIEERFGLFIFLVAFGACLLIILGLMLRHVYWKKFGVDVCPGVPRWPSSPGTTSNSRAERARQLIRDRQLAQELQSQLNEEMREQDRLAKRQERREWYLLYLKPFTAVRTMFVFT
jgi:hypothetical protein